MHSVRQFLLPYFAGLLLLGITLDTSRAAASVGVVTFALGQAELVRQNDSRTKVHKGAQVYPGDTLQTAGNGHVHLHFVDDARISVRPESTLKVLEYQYNHQAPASSRVHFRLEQGVSRSISGQAAKGAQENFRFDTPVAAIGVRGTDFTVSTDALASQAFVHEGAITVQPSQACQTDCDSLTVELSQYDHQILQVMSNNQVAYAQVQQQPYFINSDMLSGQPASSEQPADNRDKQAEMLAVDSRLGDVNSVDGFPISNQPPIIDLPTSSTSIVEQQNERQLTWGVWASNGQTPAPFILGYNEIGDGKKIAVGNQSVGLFRDLDITERVYPNLGQVAFALDQGVATLNQTPLDFSAASLNIDFDQQTFNTRLDLFSIETGMQRFDASGRVYDGGFFHSRSDTQRIGGAVSFDGSEAGYFFSKSLDAGQLEGTTLWSQP